MKKLILATIAAFLLPALTLPQARLSGGHRGSGGIRVSVTGGASDFVHDTFTDTNDTVLTSHTGETGATWTQHTATTGVIVVHTNRAFKDSTTNAAVYYASGVPGGTNYTVEGELVELTEVGKGSRICGWMDTSAVTMVCVGRINSTTMELGKFIAGVFTQLDTATITYSINTVRALKVTRNGTDYEWFLDGVSQGTFSITDTELSGAGRVGIRQTGGWVDGGNDAYPVNYIKAY